MKNKSNGVDRREFLEHTGKLAAGSLALQLTSSQLQAETSSGSAKKRLAMVGTGIRGTQTWGRDLIKEQGDHVRSGRFL